MPFMVLSLLFGVKLFGRFIIETILRLCGSLQRPFVVLVMWCIVRGPVSFWLHLVCLLVKCTFSRFTDGIANVR